MLTNFFQKKYKKALDGLQYVLYSVNRSIRTDDIKKNQKEFKKFLTNNFVCMIIKSFDKFGRVLLKFNIKTSFKIEASI